MTKLKEAGFMRIYSFRHLFICFAIASIAVVCVAFYTFSRLSLQDAELARISQSREIMKIIGSAFTHVQTLESIRANYAGKQDQRLLNDYTTTLQELRKDSLNLSALGNRDTQNAASYHQLSQLIHRLIIFSGNTIKQGTANESGAGMAIATEFSDIATRLENMNSAILEKSYSNSMTLTRQAILWVSIIVATLVIFFALSFWVVYRYIRYRQQQEDQLKTFNAELTSQVKEKTMAIREIIERVSDGFVALDENWRYTYMNKKAGQIFDRDPAQMIGRHIWTEFPEGKGQPFHKAYENAMARQEYVYLEEYYPPYDRWFENHIYPSPKGLSIYFRDITDRKKIHEALRFNEHQLKLIYNTTTDIIFLLSVESNDDGYKYRYSSVNQSFLTATGLKEEEIIGKYLEEVTPDPSIYTIMDKYQEAIQGRQAVQWEQGLDFPSGRRIGMVTVNPVFNERGECTMMVGVVHDITERKKAEEKLVLAEARFRNLVEQSLIGVYIIEGDRFKYVNPRLAEIFGYRQEELIDSDPVNIIAPADKLMVAENVRSRLEGEKEFVHYEATGMRKDGKEINIEVFCGGSLNQKSNAIMGTLLDITERKIAEQELVKVNERFNLIAKATNDVVWDWDMVNNINRGNEVFYKYYGLEPGSDCTNEDFISRVHPEDKDRIIDKLKRTIEKRGEVVLDEFRFRVADGSYRYFYDRAYIIYDKEWKPIRMLGSMMDITEKLLLEKEISDQKVQAQKMITRAVLQAEEKERNKIGQELHDNVNQLLVSAKLFLGMLQKAGNKERADKLLNDSISMVGNAIQEIRSLSQNQVTPIKESNLEELINMVVCKLRESHSMETEFTYNTDANFIEDDLKLNIYRIVQEQVNNILKHSEAGKVSISVKGDAEFIYVAIADNGKGFDVSQKRRGIGISNIINRVESFNGQMEIDSNPGAGCRINIRIPVDTGTAKIS